MGQLQRRSSSAGKGEWKFEYKNQGREVRRERKTNGERKRGDLRAQLRVQEEIERK
jgi:hypothetical protein